MIPSRYSSKDIIGIAWPIILGGIGENIINITDTAFVGHLGDAALGSVGMGSLYYYTFVLILIGLAVGNQILVGRRNGEKNYEAAGNLFDNAVYLFGSLALVLFIILHFFSAAILARFLKSPEVIALCTKYVVIRSYGLFFICFAVVFRSFLIGITKTRVIVFITLTMAAMNVVFNYMMIFGRGGFRPMGVAGSATASVIAEGTALCGYILYCGVSRKIKPYRIFRFPTPNFNLIRSITSIGFPLMLQSWISVASWFVFFVFIEKMGEQALAISAVLKSIYLLCMLPVWGFCSAANTLTSNTIGAGGADEVPSLVRRVIRISFSVILLLVLANTFAPRVIISLYSHDPAVVAGSVAPMRIISAAILVFSAGGILFNTVSGTGATRISLAIELVTLVMYLGYTVISAGVMHLPLVYVWAAELLYMSSMAVMSLAYLRTGSWKKIVV